MGLDQWESVARGFANKLGVDIHRYRPEAGEAGRLQAMLAHHGVDIVLDVGANVGQFAKRLRASGYRGRIVSYEPIQEAHARLLRASAHDPLWDVAPRSAITDRSGRAKINVARNSVSSSLLPMRRAHAEAAPESEFIGTEDVAAERLDKIAASYVSDAPAFLKIDTQGHESQVLDGASGIMDALRGIQIELSLVPLYEGQALFDELYERMRSAGFSPWAIWPGFCDFRNGRMLQVDGVFFRD